MRLEETRLYVLVLAFSAAILYGTTYQQFRFFNLGDPGGAADAVSYVEMSKGNFDVDIHRYRWITPTAARLVRPLLERVVRDQGLAVKLSFYAVNFAFSLGTCVAMFALLQSIGFPIPLALLGISAFASGRITVLVTATPMVDAAYFCAVATLLYLTVARKPVILAVLLPAMILCKETVLLFLLLPLFTDIRRSRAYFAGLATAIATFVMSRHIIDIIYPASAPRFTETVIEHLGEAWLNFERLFTLQGIHDLQNGFSLLLVLAALGALLNGRHRYYVIPRVVLLTVPIGLGYALLSGNLGRMFFVAFPAVIAYALVLIDHISRTYRHDSNVR